MRKLHVFFLWAFLALTSALQAQIDSTGPQNLIDTLFSGLDTGKISTGLLADKTLSLYVPLDKYDGTTNRSISFDEILTLPFVLNQMKMKPLSIPDVQEIQEMYAQHNESKLLVPLIIDYEYSKIDDSAFVHGLIDTSGNVWTDTIIGGMSPYIVKPLKAVAFNYSIVSGYSFVFMYDPRLYLTNKVKPAFVHIDFGDGFGIRTVNAYDSVFFKYATGGDHEIIVYKTESASSEMEKVNTSLLSIKDEPLLKNKPDCSFLYGSESIVYNSSNRVIVTGHNKFGLPIFGVTKKTNYMKALISIQLGFDKKDGKKHECLKKPLIFVDGIDFGYENHVDEYYEWANKCNSLGYDNIANAIDFNAINGTAVKDIRFQNGPEFIKRATDAGYDIIFFDMYYGAADIKLNGLLLAEFITKMNSELLPKSGCYCGKSYDEIVIVGASMGGQVARYALLDMENKKVNHCVREWISFDSPNEGANIPLGLQHFVEWSAANNKNAYNLFKASADNLSRKLDREASKQLLYYHYSEKYKSMANSKFYDFYSAMDKMGSYPKKCRKAAIACGSLNAVGQDNDIGQTYIGGNLLAQFNLPFNFIWKYGFSFHAKIYAEEGAYLSSQNCYHDYTRRYVFDASKEYNHFGRFIPLFKVTICDNVNFKGWGFDYSAGGSDDGIMSLQQTIPLNSFLGLTPGTVFHSATSFIPSVSALGIFPDTWQKNGGVMYKIEDNYGKNNISKHLPNYALSPFDAIFGPDGAQSNQKHVFISMDLISWAMDELQMGDYENVLTSNGNTGNSYNFGDKYFNRLKSIIVFPACSLKVNANDFKGYKDREAGYEEQYYASINKPADNSYFELFTTDDCKPTVVEIRGDAVFELGDGKRRQAVTHFKSGSTLVLMEGSVLHIRDGSALIIEKGAKLIYHKGSKIVLDGSSAVLQIFGELVLPDPNTIFTFTHDPALPNGFIDFVHSPTITTFGNTNRIELAGTSISSMIARISGNLTINGLYNQPTDAIASIKLQNGEVQLLGNTSLMTDASFSSSFVNFTGSGTGNSNSGLVLYGQTGISISNCRFQNLITGLEIQSAFSNGSIIVLEHNLFSQCQTGAKFTTLPVEINFSNFIHCGVGLSVDLCTKLKIENVHFTYNGTGLNYIGQNSISGVLRTCDFHYNNNAVVEMGNFSSLTIACTNIQKCTNAIYAEGNINMSKMKTDKDYGIAGGDCELINNDFFFTMNYGTLDLYNGNNNIIQGDPKKTTNFINGNIDANSLVLAVFSPNILEVENNYWSPDPSVYSSLYHFFMVTSTATYLGVMGIVNPVNTPYSNCASIISNIGGGVISDPNGAGGIGMISDIDIIQQNGSPAPQPGSVENQNGSQGMTVYPLPVSEILTIETNNHCTEEINSVELTNIEGNCFEAKYLILTGGIIKVDVSNLQNGTYFVCVTECGKRFRKSFIVLHE